MAREIIYTPNAPTPNSPYVQATKANGLVFVTGQVSRDAASGEFVDGPFEEQLRRSLANLEAILVAAGSSLDDVLKLTIFVTDQQQLDTMNRVLREVFVNPPARSSMGVAWLWKKCNVMVEAIATCN